MKLFSDLKSWLIIALLVIVAVYQFKGCDPQPPLIEHKIDTVFQDVKVEVPKYVPKWRTKVETVEIPVQVGGEPAKIDTAAILKDYYSKYKTVDTLKLPYPDSINKTFGYGVITDFITRNTIVERSIKWNYRIPTVYHTITIHPQPKAQVYIGAMANVNSTQVLSSVSGALLYKTKKERIYIANIGAANNGLGIQPFLGGGILWKIQLKKPKITDVIK